ncbi:hypothetical protein DICSQDRAFT_182693 [Dichomitus squalens LYAD-421 SS1]|uniref:DUF6533 domain-containing protein n=1 Tax=Dichomitus squalens (strain LYAD-421) TaxID=732165 RepID=R7SQ70_DICSQ|nr:uncharacterized protein DICSQDRAFT_182693 [Dichomitus squalens LYAD-421 SS1]EJF58206.1 hypothetical protein DICSQDRAFT_182693 [Dichomitus squalens LYAD-421 SS1]
MADQPSQLAEALHELHELVTSVRNVRATQLVSFVTATIVIYDYIVCMEREIELIWKKRWSVIKLAFLWHRYFGVACVLFQVYAFNSPIINDEVCTFWFYWETWGYCGILFTSEAVLLLWIYVVYNKNKWILALTGICYIAEITSVVSILTISFEHFEARAFHANPNVDFCFLHVESPFPLLWVPILAYDSLLLLLFVYRGCAGMTSTRGWRWAYTYDGLLDMIYRHSLLNFLAIFASYLACALIWMTSSDIGTYQAPVAFALSLSITNCTRLLLNIRRAYYSGVGDPILFNIRDLPATGANTPVAIDLPLHVPVSPLAESSAISAFTSLSETTLREATVTPTSTLCAPSASPLGSERVPSVSPLGSGRVALGRQREAANGRTLAPTPVSLSTATSAETLRPPAAPRHAHEYPRESTRVEVSQGNTRTVYVSGEVDLDWWHVELREMRASPDVSFGQAV